MSGLVVGRRGAAVIVGVVFLGSTGLVSVPVLAGQTRAAVDGGPQQLAERVAAGTWDTFSMRVTVRREWVPAADSAEAPLLNAAAGPAVSPRLGAGLPPVVDEYVWERRKTATGWRSRMTIVNETVPVVQGHLGPVTVPPERGIAWMEDAEDGSLPRFFTKNGSEVVLPSAGARERLLPMASAGAAGTLKSPAVDADLVTRVMAASVARPTPGREWVRSVVLMPNERQQRMMQVTRRFGRRAGWVRGYGQYLRAAGTQSVEWLVDEQDGVPVEVNVTEAGRLRVQTRLSYERAASGALLRRGVRVERAVDAADGAVTGDRTVTEIGYSDIRLLTTGGGR